MPALDYDAAPLACDEAMRQGHHDTTRLLEIDTDPMVFDRIEVFQNPAWVAIYVSSALVDEWAQGVPFEIVFAAVGKLRDRQIASL